MESNRFKTPTKFINFAHKRSISNARTHKHSCQLVRPINGHFHTFLKLNETDFALQIIVTFVMCQATFQLTIKLTNIGFGLSVTPDITSIYLLTICANCITQKATAPTHSSMIDPIYTIWSNRKSKQNCRVVSVSCCACVCDSEC